MDPPPPPPSPKVGGKSPDCPDFPEILEGRGVGELG